MSVTLYQCPNCGQNGLQLRTISRDYGEKLHLPKYSGKCFHCKWQTKSYYSRTEVSGFITWTLPRYFAFDASTGTITSFYPSGNPAEYWQPTDIVIPPTIDGVAVTIIGTSAFYNQTDLKTMTFPSTLVRIQNGGLQACAGISELVFPDGFTIAGQAALYDCSSLIKVTLPADVTFGSFNLGLENDYDGTAGVWNLVDGTWTLEE